MEVLLPNPEPVLTMMNKEELNNEMNLVDRNVGLEIIEATGPDDRKPSANMAATGKLSLDPASPDRKVKRKRRSPEKPWKKPADMPKRPLSAYNLFFKDERERLLSACSEGKQGEVAAGGDADDTVEGRPAGKGSAKKQKKSSGIGFANLAKSIAAKWKDLEDDVRAPYERIAATEKKKYDELVAEWRIKQAAKKKAVAAAKKEEDNERILAPSYREPTVPKLFSSEQSLGSFSDTSNPYPPEWFHSAEGSERDDRVSRGAVPPVVDTSPGASYERRSYDSMASPGYHYMQDPASSYYYGNTHHQHGYDEAESSYSRHTPDTHRTGYSYGSFSPDLTHSPVPNSGYREYYHHTQQSIYQHHASSSGRHSDIRAPRASSLPVPRHSDASSPSETSGQSHRRQFHSLQSPYRRSSRDLGSSGRYHGRGSASGGSSGSSAAAAMVYPRSASMPSAAPHHRPSPPLGESLGVSGGGPSRHRGPVMMSHDGDELMQDSSYRSVATAPTTIPTTARAVTASRRRHLYPSDQVLDASLPPPAAPNDDAVETSLQSLTDSLDEDAISFITSMKYS